jgi:branched-chain amino acid transport system permease protein
LQTILQNLIFGLFVGSVYGIAAAGLSLIFGVLKMLNVAHGELLMIGAYVSFWLFIGLGLDPFLSLLLVIPVLFALGMLLEYVLFSRVARLETETKIKNSLLISFGLAMILQNVALQLWTADERSTQTSYSGLGFEVLGIVLPYTRLAILAIALLCILAMWLFLQRTQMGRAIRATADDWEAASLAGINIRQTSLFTFGLGAASAGIAGALVAVGYGITPAIGLAWTLKSMVIVVLAGTGSIIGAFPAGLILGLAESISGMTFGSAYREVVGLVLFLAILVIRPQGLFAQGQPRKIHINES